MDERIKFFVGLDAHKDSIAIAACAAGREPARFVGTMGPDVNGLLKLLAKAGVNGGRNPRESGDEVTAAERTPHRCPADDSGVQGVEGTAAEGALEGARRATGDAPSAARRRGAVARPAAEMTSGIEMR